MARVCPPTVPSEEQPMSRRRLLLLSLLLLVPALGILCLYLDALRERQISRVNAERIKPGMTKAEVERLLGGARSQLIGKPDEPDRILLYFTSGPGRTCGTWCPR